MKKINLLVILSFTLLLLTRCSNDFLDEQPLTFFSEDNFYNSEEGMDLALIGLYAKFSETLDFYSDNRNMFHFGMVLGTDIAEPLPYQYRGEWRIGAEYNQDWNPQYEFINLWGPIYSAVGVTNSLLTNINKPDWTSDEQKNRIKGNALFFRAYWYLWLVQTYGDVPLVTEPLKEPKTDFIRTPKSEVVDQMIIDLTEAVNILPEFGTLQGEFGKGAAQHLLTNVYLYQNDWVKAEQTASELIEGGTYRLMTERFGVEKDLNGTPFTDLFLDGNQNRWEGNEENIWTFQGGDKNIYERTGMQLKVNWLTQYDRVEGIARSVEYWQRAKAYIRVSQYYLNLFDPDYRWGVNFFEPKIQDDRGSEFAIHTIWRYNDAGYIQSQKNAGTPLTQIVRGVTVEVNVGDTVVITQENSDFLYPTPTKLLDRFTTSVSETRTDKDYPMMRLAETYLFRAEARFHLGDLSGAADDINMLRRRAHAPEISPDDVDIDLILDESAKELCAESSRKFLLLRTGKFMERNKLYNIYGKDIIQEKHKLYPIPQVEIDRMKDSPNFPQNPGY